MSEPEPPVDRSRSSGSRLLSGVDQWASRPLTALIVLTVDTAWVLLSLAVGFPARWETVFQTLVAALTLAMVFIIQHTQARQEAATQRKLDEILQAQLGVAQAEALIRIRACAFKERACAFKEHRGLTEVAVGVVARRLRFGPATE